MQPTSPDNQDNPKPSRLIPIITVCDRTGLSPSTIYDRLASRGGDFPNPKKVGKRAVRWLEQEVSDWIESRISTRERTAAKGGVS